MYEYIYCIYNIYILFALIAIDSNDMLSSFTSQTTKNSYKKFLFYRSNKFILLRRRLSLHL